MKKIIVLFLGFLLTFFSCKDDDIVTNCEPNCPLPNGDYCTGDLININNQCVCPEGSVKIFADGCIDIENNNWLMNSYFTVFETISCGCISGSNLLLKFDVIDNEFSIFHINYSYLNGMGIDGPVNTNEHIFGPSTPSNFYGDLYPMRCNDNDLMMHGSIIGDTLYYDLFFYNTTDTCKGFKVADARL